MARPRIGEKRRLNLDMPETVLSRLEKLRENTEAASMSEVVRRSLAVYEFLAAEKRRGTAVVLRDADGAERELELFL